MSNADGFVVPKPGVPKTLGILNIIFGVLGLLVGVCGLGGMLLLPAGMEIIEKTAKEAQSKVETRQKAEVKAIDDKLAAAKTDEEKKAIEQERTTAIANQPKMPTVDMSAATDLLKNPTVMGVSIAQLAVSIVLSIMALTAGIGLIRLTAWGRSLALWEAGLRIFQIVAFLAVNLAVVLPIQQAANEKQIAKLEEAAKGPNAGPADGSVLQMTKTMSGMAAPLAVVQSLPWTIYPIVLLILLNTKGARAACLPKASTRYGDI